MRAYDRKLLLEDGQEFFGYGFGVKEERALEVVCNTSMVGYVEILSDPSYTDQAVAMTYPLIGNYGVTEADFECKRPGIGALLVRACCEEPSNFRCEKTLSEVMEAYGIAGLMGLDTRRLARVIRERGACRALLTGIDTPKQEGLCRLQEAPVPRDAVARASCRALEVYPAAGKAKYRVAALDCGMKRGIVRQLSARACEVTAVPWTTSAEEILALRPDGVLLSNGPGDPTDVPEAIETVRALLGKVPLFGICLGHQILSLSYGARTYKLKFGHRGGNHPVRTCASGKIEITSQNHSYAVEEASLRATPLTLTHRNLLDGTIEGVACARDRAFGVQFHPESAPGPQDSRALFDRFIQYMEEHRHAQENGH